MTTKPYLFALAAVVAALSVAAHTSRAQDPIRGYFTGGEGGIGDIGAYTFDSAGNFWTGSLTVSGNVRRVVNSGGTWSATTYVPSLDWQFFLKSDNIPAGTTRYSSWGGSINGAIGAFLLNPAPITVPLSSGGSRTYQPGQLAYITDGFGSIFEQPSGLPREDVVKRLYRFDLRAIDASTSTTPDFNNASNGDDPSRTIFGATGKADWNDVLTPVLSAQNLRTAAAAPTGSSTFAREFAWSSNGQRIYAVDSGAGLGGIYRIDATQVGVVTQVWKDTVTERIASEPAVIHTSVRDLDPSSSAVGDQIVVSGSTTGGNVGGANVFFDSGSMTTLAAPKVLWTANQFRDFAEVPSFQDPEVSAFEFDAQGNLYFYENQTDGLYRFDTQGRFTKLLSEREHNNYQQLVSGNANGNDIKNKLQTRASNAPGFAVTEVMFQDNTLEAPLGVLAYKTGDFNRDNAVNSADFSLFSAALRTRGTAADDANLKFDLNGNAVLAFDAVDNRFEPVTNGQMVVDWKDVKILQQFVGFANGDVNFDMLLNFTDIDVMNANYFTVPGQNAETWITGDIASIDPAYAFNAVDANIVNRVDLDVMAAAWVGLGQPKPTNSQLSARYSGTFLTDVTAAFAAIGSSIAGDFSGDGRVDSADLALLLANWGSTVPPTPSGWVGGAPTSPAVDSDELARLLSTWGVGTSVSIPEPTGVAIALACVAVGAIPTRRRSAEFVK
jgi:hypothetical protein